MCVCANLNNPVILEPGQQLAIPTGICLEISSGWKAKLYSRGSLVAKGISTQGSPITFTSDHPEEVKVVLRSNSLVPFTIEPGMKIGSLILTKEH